MSRLLYEALVSELEGIVPFGVLAQVKEILHQQPEEFRAAVEAANNVAGFGAALRLLDGRAREVLEAQQLVVDETRRFARRLKHGGG